MLLKPHHFADIVAALGAGRAPSEPHPYGHALHSVAARVLGDRDALLEITLDADAVCAPCRHNVNGLCDDAIDTSYRPAAPASKREWNGLIDRRWCDGLGLAPGARLGARELCERLGEAAGDLAGIYRELPAERVAAKAADLREGVRKFLGTE